MTTTTVERVSTNDFKQYGRLIAETIVEAINDHGVTYRHIDGSHVRLYCGNRDVIPIKVSKSRQPENQIKFLLRWLGENVPTWNDRHVTPEALARLKAVFNGEEEKPKRTPRATKAAQPEPAKGEWVPALTRTGNDYNFETNGSVFRCTVPGCGHTQAKRQGMHLHHQHHVDPGAAGRNAALAGAARARKVAERARNTVVVATTPEERPMVASVAEPEQQNAVEMALDTPAPGYPQGVRAAYPEPRPTPATPEQEEHAVQQALIILAAAHGMTLIPEAELESLRLRLSTAEQMLAETGHERDEAKARLSIIQEAMGL